MTLESPRLEKALTQALAGRGTELLFDELQRVSGLPGSRPNLDLARIIGAEVAGKKRRADPLLDAMLAAQDEYLTIVAAMTLAARYLAGVDPVGALRVLHDISEHPHLGVRAGVIAALRDLVAARGEAVVAELGAWTDGFLHAHVVLEALCERTLLASLASGTEVMARLDEAFDLGDEASRAADRSQGLRTLRKSMPAQIALIAARWPETLAWLDERAKRQRPETREVIEATVEALRRAGFAGSKADHLARQLSSSAPLPRDPSRIVQGTRKRGGGRRR